jgi:hypothetical protein
MGGFLLPGDIQKNNLLWGLIYLYAYDRVGRVF